ARRRFSMFLLSTLAGIALVLAAAGVYGVMSHSTARRSAEIGIRMALGSRRADVFKLVLGEGLVLSLVGVIAGLTLGGFSTRLLASLLYGVRPTDWSAFLGASLFLIAVALLAGVIPARRATKVDPILALRSN